MFVRELQGMNGGHHMLIGRIDGIRPGIPGSVMGTNRVRPHHLIGVDWAQNQSR